MTIINNLKALRLYTSNMANKKTNIFKRVATDTAGVIMLIGAVAFGWIPGPGGLPLLLGGLGLLSINHEWARKLLTKVKDRGSSLYSIFFPDNKYTYWLYDLVGLAVFISALYVVSLQTKNITQTVAIGIAVFAVGLLLTNRKRLEKITQYISKLKKRKQ